MFELPDDDPLLIPMSKAARATIEKLEYQISNLQKRANVQDRALADAKAKIDHLANILATEKAAREWIAKLRGEQP